jgi:hypothetical protein
MSDSDITCPVKVGTLEFMVPGFFLTVNIARVNKSYLIDIVSKNWKWVFTNNNS